MVKNHNRKAESQSSREEVRRLAGLVASLPDYDPPVTIIEGVMTRIQPKRIGIMKRAWRRLRAPIRLSPLWAGLAGMAAAGTLLFVTTGHDHLGKPEFPEALMEKGSVSAKTVFFTLHMPEASRVDVIGSFNQWAPGLFSMEYDEALGLWVCRLKLDEGRHEYAFLVDGKRVVPDPKSLFQENDGFGNQNSILIIQGNHSHETGI